MDDDDDDVDDDEAWVPEGNNRGNGTAGNAGEGSGTVRHQGTQMDSHRSQAAASPAEAAADDSAVKLRRVGDGGGRRCLRCCP